MLNNFPLYHHLPSLCVKLTTDPAIELVGSWAVRFHFSHTFCFLSLKAPQCSGLVSRQAPWEGELGGVCVRETAMPANKSCSSRFCFVLSF